MAGMIPPQTQACFIFVQCSNRPAPSFSLIYGHNIAAVAPAFISIFQVSERKKYQSKKDIAPKQSISLLTRCARFPLQHPALSYACHQ